MVGAKKIVMSRSDLQSPVKELLDTCNVVQLLAEGSEEHKKAGLTKNKILVKAYKQCKQNCKQNSKKTSAEHQ